MIIMLGFVGYDWWLERRAHFVRYPEFGIDIPVIILSMASMYPNTRISLIGDRQGYAVGNVQLGFGLYKSDRGSGQ